MKKSLMFLTLAALLLGTFPSISLGGQSGQAAAAPPLIAADGDLSDWAGIWSLAPGEDKIAILYALRTDSQLAIAFQAPDTTDIGIYDIVLDLDNNPETGYRTGGRYKQAGGDFLIETWTAGFYTDDPTGEE